MSGRALYLGVDGGGTKTHFVCIDGDGTVVAEAVLGTSYHLQVGLAGALDVLALGIGDVCRRLMIAPEALDYCFFGLPAFGEDARIDPQLAAGCGNILGHDRYRCGNDMICGWAGSLGCQDGINIVAGTGSIGYGERRGVAARSGGWGEVFSDEGSAYWIAVRGLAAFAKMSDGRLAKGALHAQFRRALDLGDDLDLCAIVMGPEGMSRDAIADLARHVSAAAEAGDPVAAEILDDAAEELAQIARALRARLGYEAGEAALLSWSGGVVAHMEPVRAALHERLNATGQYELVRPRFSPGVGSAIYAGRLAGAVLAHLPRA